MSPSKRTSVHSGLWALFGLSLAAALLALSDAKAQSLEDRLPYVDPSKQYLIQTDKGPERFFRYQTLTGTFRKEKRFPDGSVTGTYGWVDPNGILRLYDYVSDDQGYRIEKTRLFKAGRPTTQGAAFRIPSRGAGDFEVGFEVVPLDFDSDPNFEVEDGQQLGNPLRAKQAVSLTSAFQEPRNPISQQGQATFFELEPAPPTTTTTTTPKPYVIGAAHNQAPKSQPRSLPFVIGAAANGRFQDSGRPAPRAAAVGAAAATAADARSIKPAAAAAAGGGSRRRPIVIGLRYDRR